MDQSLLDLRPVHVMHRLGAESRVPLLNGRTLLDACAEAGRVMWAPQVVSAAQARALLLAAAHQHSLCGAVLAPPRSDPQELRREFAPAAWMQPFLDAASEMEGPPPFCLHLQAPPFDSPAGAAGRAAAWLLEAGLEAGFTSFGLDLGALPESERTVTAVQLLGPVLELELCIVLRIPLGPDGEHSTLSLLKELRAQGLLPDLLWLSVHPDMGPATAAAARLAPLLAPTGVALPAPVDSWQHLRDAGVRAVWGDERLAGSRNAPSRPEVAEAGAYLECVEAFTSLGLRSSAGFLVSQ